MLKIGRDVGNNLLKTLEEISELLITKTYRLYIERLKELKDELPKFLLD